MIFDGPFYDYFIAKHGKEVFDEIQNMILSKIGSIKHPVEKKMSRDKFLKIYVLLVYEVAISDFWGMNNKEITKYLKALMGNKMIGDVSVRRIKMIHHDAIKVIQSYLEETANEVQEEFYD